jgi:hypothetical protein
MKCPCDDKVFFKLGVSLIETVIALGVLAVAVPMVFAALGEASRCGLTAQAETRSAWMIPTCLEEIRASRNASPRYFASTSAGQTFPPPGDLWALAFSPEGEPVGKISQALYEGGLRLLDGKKVLYILSMAALKDTGNALGAPSVTPLLAVRISLEYPAGSPASKRRSLQFHTRMP